MTTVITHPDCLQHLTPLGHPERVARLERVLENLKTPEFQALTWAKAPLVADDDLARAHTRAHIQDMRDSVPEHGIISLDADTHMSAHSLDAALRAAGAVVRGVDMVMTGEAHNVFAAVRPPGHHAERGTPMGFCLFGTAAIAAKYAIAAHGLNRVAMIDFDVHHGNGSQDILEGDGRIFYASSHQMPLFPGTGHPHETGAANNVVNVALPDGSNGAAMRAAYGDVILPAVERFAPELIIISAGFDAHRDDPLAGLNWERDDFIWLTQEICRLAARICQGRVVSTLEGGYDLDALGECAAAHVKVLMEQTA